ncbi:hypothetical protein Esti_001801 [Eimeria stiedai]
MKIRSQTSPTLPSGWSLRRLGGCLKLRVIVSPLPQSQEAVKSLSYAGAEWLALRRALVEGRARGAFGGVCTRRRLRGSQGALTPSFSCPSPLKLHEGRIEARGEQQLGPALCALLEASHFSLQLYSQSQTKACPRLRLRRQQLNVEAVYHRLPATHWEAVLLQGGFYERKLRQYLLSNQETAAPARKLLIFSAEDTSTSACNEEKGAEADGSPGATVSAAPSAAQTQLAGWGSRCNPFYKCEYGAMVLLPIALRQRILRTESKQQKRRMSNLRGADEESSRRKCSSPAPFPKVELRAFHLVDHDHQQQVLKKLLDVEEDGLCCLCILNGCFRLRRPGGLLTHSHVTQLSFSATVRVPPRLHTPLDMFVPLKLELRGPASALCWGRPRHILPEVHHQQQQQHQQWQRLQKKPSQQMEPYAGLSLNETSMLINHDVHWRQKASRCGVWSPPTIIAMDTFGCLRLLSRLLLPALPPVTVTVPFDAHCFEKTAAFVSLALC